MGANCKITLQHLAHLVRGWLFVGLGKNLYSTSKVVYSMSKQIFITLSTYPLFLLQLPQLHVFDALLLIGLLDKRDLFKAFCSLKIVNLWHKKEELKPRSCTGTRYFCWTYLFTFFSWFFRRSCSSFFSFSSCSTCLAMMKSGSSSSRSCKKK